MASYNKRVHYKHPKRKINVGARPGSIIIPDDAQEPRIIIYSFNEDDLQTSKGKDMKTITQQIDKCKGHTHWIKINGLGDANLIEDIGTFLGINLLVLEDVVNTHQRPKFDEYEGYVFGTSRIIYFNKDNELINCQFSGLVKDNIIISFEESHFDYFEVVTTRLKAGKGVIRTAGPGYIFYALTDTILDNYFVLLSKIGDMIDETEDKLYKSPDKSIMFDAQQLKRTLIIIRRACWPERDKINDMIRSESSEITKDTKLFLRDAYDHCIQAMDMVESYKEVTSSIIDLYLSMVSNRMNEIMKVLTIISVIFIPLTFIAGIYGMNFSRQDDHGRIIKDNMPELYVNHGYVYALVGMFLIGAIQLFVFWRKGWFNKL
ncbi:magnesium/cobalt transporter CorA [Mucilaginibacter phyllosphaerae]|uniref:Magnesium transport protein CorA n=1 Tax=Mucilaginibacter phyllosphaerae TaxID=1812349 RepID=A0A4Y8AI55_9SPHI|nr:magnesium/cobalt transporter CorA [Mucilaginibacter phyllosphaerae]MBB3968228.1 magnesium transporter [Mucilaginibacter phyllosphaerae]TEW68764.1 magnesium/cobalt transporter CorA [Mucilaginibacter phyllosphaerae]GGH00373.1 magnesium and cobalt transport protein CorA [Mucilaginibacter phyllosphaerae]